VHELLVMHSDRYERKTSLKKKKKNQIHVLKEGQDSSAGTSTDTGKCKGTDTRHKYRDSTLSRSLKKDGMTDSRSSGARSFVTSRSSFAEQMNAIGRDISSAMDILYAQGRDGRRKLP
jgi:hypothetical protein